MRGFAALRIIMMMAMMGQVCDAATCCERCRDLEFGLFILDPDCINTRLCLGCIARMMPASALSGFYFLDSINCQCQYCPYGYKCPNNIDAVACQPGTYQDNYMASTCKNCDTGTYQDQSSQYYCKSCATYCNSGKRLVQCTSSAVGYCVDCDPGTYMWNNDYFQHTQTACTQCESGKYQNLAGSTACKTLTVCPAAQYASVAGTATQDTQCAGCATCNAEYYIRCPRGSTAQACSPCTGGSVAPTFCAAGTEPNVVCTGTETVDSVCGACPAGKHKPLGTRQKMCEQCPTGFYKLAAATTANCTACTNNIGKAVYTAWGAAVASSNACPFLCVVGYYKSGSGCVACNATAGTYSSAAGVTGTGA